MNKLLIPITLVILLTTSCFVETRQPPVYQELEEKVILENGDKFKEIAKKASENFHSLYNQKKFDELFDLIDDKSQLKADRVYWSLYFSKSDRHLGKIDKAEFTMANVFKKSKTHEVRIEYNSRFEKEKAEEERYEIFFWEVYENGEVKLLNYLNVLSEKE